MNNSAKKYFQAIGTLRAKVSLTEYQSQEGETKKKFVASLQTRDGDKSYDLVVPRKIFKKLGSQIEKKDALFLRVYPKTRFNENRDANVLFQVVAYSEENQWKEEPNIFKLKGVWQFVPNSRVPVLSVYRNKKAIDPSGRFKASHLPILMRREDVQPFKYNPRKDKSEQSDRYFLEVTAKFIPGRNSWGFIEDISAPGGVPYYKKPAKNIIANESTKRGRRSQN